MFIGIIIIFLIFICIHNLEESVNSICTIDYDDSTLLLIGEETYVTVNDIDYGKCCCAVGGGICDCQEKVK
jgi:hypothetical protein